MFEHLNSVIKPVQSLLKHNIEVLYLLEHYSHMVNKNGVDVSYNLSGVVIICTDHVVLYQGPASAKRILTDSIRA